MKKLFLIPLMALCTCVMAWADNEAKIGTTEYATLKAALDAASSGATVELLKDVSYTDAAGTANLNINKSLTLDGKGHTITGYSKRSGKTQYATIWINLVSPSASNVTVIFKDVKVINPKSGSNTWAIHTRGKIDSVAVVDSYLAAYMTPFQVGGNQATKAKITMINSQLYTPEYYCVVSYNPYILKAENCQFDGWNALYFKGVDGSAGSRGSEVTANNCKFNCPNYNSGTTNSFGMFVFEDDGISVSLNNCSMDAEQFGDQYQWIAVLSSWGVRREQAVNLSISGDNTYINGLLMKDSWAKGDYSYWEGSKAIYTYGEYEVPSPHPLSITISGGTYNFNPATTGWYKDATLEEPDLDDESNIALITIPAGYEVKEIKTYQGADSTILYRVRKTITTSYNINENVESKGEGVNPNTEFLISANDTVKQESTVAHYVEVSGNATLTLPAGNELEVTNGLDVTGNATLEVQAGSTLIVGEGGVTSEDVNSIVIEANENGSASFLLDPEVIVNTTPNVTIKMTTKPIGYEMDEEEQEYYWFRFAAPVAGIEGIDKDPIRGTYIYKWNYAIDDWSSISALSELVPFQGFSLTTNHEGLEEVTYTFKGRLAGNQDSPLQFKSRGFNYFGNSYTGYIDAVALIQQLMENDAIDGVVYMWNNENQRFKDVPLGDLAAEPVDSWKRQIAPMQTFILRQINTGEPTSTKINYASAIWGNPRYGIVPASAPARKFANNSNVNKLTVVVSAANGKVDDITFKEGDEFSDEYNKGFEAVKYMNERQINLYSTIDNENYGTVATNNIEGKLINMKTVKALDYTMSFENVNSEEYAIRDNVTGAIINITEGNTYEFTAQPNSTVEGRFEIVNRHNAPTAIENTEVKANVKGIYTIMGQYLGEDFDVLPAGVYVVNGVKIVK